MNYGNGFFYLAKIGYFRLAQNGRFHPALTGCLDIYYKTNSDCVLYSSGQIGSGMNTSISKATHIRRIVPYKNSTFFFQNYLETMNVTFIRNGQLTVLPFPFKYLREYSKLRK